MERFSFFDAEEVAEGEFDRTYNSQDVADYFASFIGNGVYPNPANQLMVSASGSSRDLIVSEGKGWINGRFYENTEPLVLTVDYGDTAYPRIDAVVLRLDMTKRLMEVKVKQGAAASVPFAPTLERTASIWELCLAEVSVAAGAATLSGANVKDTRPDSAKCGWVSGVVEQIDTTGLFNQFETAFDEWFEGVRDILDSDTAGNLLNLINANTAEIAEMDSAKVNRSGDTMTGTLEVDSSDTYADIRITREYSDQTKSNVAILATSDTNTGLSRRNMDGTIRNELRLNDGSTELGKPLTVASGGTGVTSTAAIRKQLGLGFTTEELGVSYGGTGLTQAPVLTVNLGATNTVNVFTPTPSVGVKGTLPISHGGTGSTTTSGAKSNLGIADVAKTVKSFNLDSGHLTGSIHYYMKNGIVFVGADVNRVAGGGISNGLRSSGVTLPTNMRPTTTTRSCQLTPFNNTPDPCPNVGITIGADGGVSIWYGAINAPSTGYTWSYSGWVTFGPGM